MSNKRKLVFLNCFSCTKTINIDDLIELTTNSLLIGDRTIDFSDLILDVCMHEVCHLFF